MTPVPVLVAGGGVFSRWTLEVVGRSDLHRVVVLPKRWIVERTLAWIGRTLRLCRGTGRRTRKAAALVRLATIRIMLRRCAAGPSTRDRTSRTGS